MILSHDEYEVVNYWERCHSSYVPLTVHNQWVHDIDITSLTSEVISGGVKVVSARSLQCQVALLSL